METIKWVLDNRRVIVRLVSKIRISDIPRFIYFNYRSFRYRKDIQKFVKTFSDEKFLNLFPNKKFQLNENFLFEHSKKRKIIKAIKKYYPESIFQTINDADDICNHIFDLQGSGKTYLGKEIDWHTDFKSGYRWNPKECYLGKHDYQMPRLHKGIKSDIEVVYMLNCFHHLITLGKAYWYTNDEKYAKEFVSEVENWIDTNPVAMGVNWSVSMYVAIPAIEWIVAYYFFNESKTLTDKFRLKFLKNLFLKGHYLINNLTFRFVRGNHYIAQLTGLLCLGLFFRETNEGKKWINLALKELEREIELQVHQDGADFEASICYHRYVTEMFLFGALLCKRNKIDVSSKMWKHIEKMIEYITYYTKPDGSAPIIGDHNNIKLTTLARNDINDHRSLIAAGAALFGRKDFKSICKEFDEEAFWLLGEEGLERFKKIGTAPLQSKAFSKAGMYIMRKDDLYTIINCGKAGEGLGGHAHNDIFSFELFAKDKSFIVDPGSYVYAAEPEWRNKFKSTRYHNTIVVDGAEQNDMYPETIFGLIPKARIKINKWFTNEFYDFLDAEHDGYKRLNNPVIHRRQIYFNKEKECWVIHDILTGKGKHKFDLYFHLNPLKLKKKSNFIYTESEGYNLALLFMNGEINIENGWVSKTYGIKSSAPIIHYSKVSECPAVFTTLLYPFKERTLNEKEHTQLLNEFDNIMVSLTSK